MGGGVPIAQSPLHAHELVAVGVHGVARPDDLVAQLLRLAPLLLQLFLLLRQIQNPARTLTNFSYP